MRKQPSPANAAFARPLSSSGPAGVQQIGSSSILPCKQIQHRPSPVKIKGDWGQPRQSASALPWTESRMFRGSAGFQAHNAPQTDDDGCPAAIHQLGSRSERQAGPDRAGHQPDACSSSQIEVNRHATGAISFAQFYLKSSSPLLASAQFSVACFVPGSLQACPSEGKPTDASLILSGWLICRACSQAARSRSQNSWAAGWP